MQRVFLALVFSFICCFVMAGAAEGREVHKVQTTSGDTYYPLRMSMHLKCSGKVPRGVRSLTRVTGDSESRGSWDDLPNFYMEWDKERTAYILLSDEDKPEEREEIGYVEVDRAYRGNGCRHYIKVEALGGVTRSILVSKVKWPIEVHRKSN